MLNKQKLFSSALLGCIAEISSVHPAVSIVPFVLKDVTLILCYRGPIATERELTHLSPCNLILLSLDRGREGPRSYSQTIKYERKFAEGLLEEIIPQNKERSHKKKALQLVPPSSLFGMSPCKGLMVRALAAVA